MSAEQLLAALRQKNVEVWVEGKLLRFRAPGNALDADLLAEMRRHKSAIIKALNGATKELNGECSMAPMSLGQQALYFLHSIAPISASYNVASAARICSLVDTAAMRQAFEHLVARHDALRTTFEDRQGQPQRCIHAHGELDFQQLHVSEVDEDSLRQLVRREYQRPFNLKTGPLLRVRLFTLAPADHVFLMSLHHIVFDAWSLWLLQDEFRLMYQQYCGRETALLPALDTTYSDFVDAQQKLAASETGERLWTFWQHRLSGDLAHLDLPVDRPRTRRTSRRGATHRFHIPRELAAQLKQLASAHGATPFMLMLAIFKTWLFRATGQSDLIVGTATSGRKSRFARVVGYFVNALVIRSEAGEPLNFLDFLAHVKQRTVEAIDHEEYPFPLLVKRLNPPRDAAWLPICNVMFGLQKPQQFSEVTRLFEADHAQVDWGGLQVHPFELDQQEGQFDLTLEFFETHDSYLGVLKYDLDLWDASSAERIGQHFVHLAQRIADDPDRRLAEYEISPADERARVMQFGAAAAVTPLDANHAHGLFERQAARCPDQPAAICDECQMTYEQLNRRANQVARHLQAKGVGPGSLVACALKRGMDIPLVLLGILKAGAVYMPLDTDSPAIRLRQIIARSQAKFVVASSGVASALAPCDGEFQRIVQEELVTASQVHADSNLSLSLPPEALAYVMHTSGSTGIPKGVCITHRAFVEQVTSIREAFGLTPHDRMLQFNNLTFDPSLNQMFCPWSLGGAVVLRGDVLWTPDEFWQVVQRHQVTVADLPPPYYQQISDSLDRIEETKPLRVMIVGGDVFPAATLPAWKCHQVKVINAYGPTEAVIAATTYDTAQFDGRSSRVPIGVPKPGTRVYVLDRHGRLAPQGFPGELCIGGTMLAEGYLHDEPQTAQKFVPDPFVAGGRMYHTGDRVRWTAGGQLEFLGRADRQIKIHGQRMEAAEIEHALNACPGVKGAFVQARRNSAGESYLVAWVVAPDASEDERHRIREFLRGRLPATMIPREFVTVCQLPVNAAGKVDIRRLPEPSDRRLSRVEYAPPCNEIEKQLAAIWTTVLNVETVGVHDNFFDLGGGSLASLQMVSQAREAGLKLNGEPLSPELVFEYPSIRELADYLESAQRS